MEMLRRRCVMLKEIARYGKFKTRDKPNEGVSEVVDKPVIKVIKRDKLFSGIYNPFDVYDFDVNFAEEVIEDEPNIHEQDS